MKKRVNKAKKPVKKTLLKSNKVYLWILLIVVGLVIFYRGLNNLRNKYYPENSEAVKASYQDGDIGFSFEFPHDKFRIIIDPVKFWQEKNPKGVILVNAFPIDENGQKYSLGPDYFNVSNSQVVTAIDQGTELVLDGSGQLENIKLGTNRFLRLFPTSQEGCFCYQVQYVTVVGEHFVTIQMYVPSEDVPNFDGEYEKDPEALIVRLYGDLEGILSSFSDTKSKESIGGKVDIVFPTSESVLIKGQTYPLSWKGGPKIVNIFLIDKALESEGVSISISDRVYNLENSGAYEYTVPDRLPDGLYKFEIENAETPYFRIVSGKT